MLWIIIVAILILVILVVLIFSYFGNWRLTLIRLANSYIYGVEQEKLSEKEAFFKALQSRYQLKKAGELLEELEGQGLNEEEMNKEVLNLLRSNSLFQNKEYKYEYILKRKGFMKKATDLSLSRSPVEGGMWAGRKVEKEMDELSMSFDGKDLIKKDNYSLLELLVCVMIIEHSQKIRGKTRDEVVKMVTNHFGNRYPYQKYLKKRD